MVDDDNTPATDTGNANVNINDVLPDISVTKTANPTAVVAPGGNVTFTYVVTNNSVESVTITELSDDKFGTLTGDSDCQLGTVLAANGGTCSFSIVRNITGTAGTQHKNVFTAKASDNDGNTDTATDDATVDILAATGQIAPTATTCTDFRNGTAGNLTEILYGLKGQKINNVAPGVLFYYSLVTVPAGTHTISVTQTTSPSFTLFGVQQDRAILWSFDYMKVQNNATGSFTVTNSVETTYILGIKYDPTTVVGKTSRVAMGK